MLLHATDKIEQSVETTEEGNRKNKLKSFDTCRYKYVLGANDRKMQKGSSSNASTLLVAPRDHFLDNAGMSEPDSDQEAIEEGMLIEAPVTPEKSLAAQGAEDSYENSEKANEGADGSSDGSGKANEVAERSDQRLGEADGMAEGSDLGSEKADQNGAVGAATAFAVPSTPLVCHICCNVCSKPWRLPQQCTVGHVMATFRSNRSGCNKDLLTFYVCHIPCT